MKKVLLFILMFAAFASNAQTVGQFRYDTTIFRKVGGRNHVKIDSLIQVADSTGYKPLVVGADGVIKRNTFWPTGAGGGSGSIEYVLQGYGILIDSTGRLYTIKADSTVMGSKAYINAKDALYLPITDTASMLSPYLRSATAAATYATITNLNLKASQSALVDTAAAIRADFPTGGGGINSVVAGTNVTVDNTDPSNPIVSASGGGGASNSVTEQKIYYRGEFIVGRAINTGTGAVTVTGTDNVTDYLHVAGSESVTISVPDGYSNVTIYGWTYDTTLTAISEIRSNALIGTGLKTYTFTTPSDARFINIYTKYAGVDFGKALSIKSTNTFTHPSPFTPEQYTGAKSTPIQTALNEQRFFPSSAVVLTGSYLVDSSLIMSSGNTLVLDNATLTLDSASKTNVIRNEAVANPNAIFARGNRGIKIIGIGNAVIQGSKSTWGGYPATGVGTQYWRAINTYLANVEGFEVSGITFKNTNMWAVNAEQSRLGLIENITFQNDSSRANQDGINLRRGTERVTVQNIKGQNWDDMVALTNLKIGGDSLHILGISTIYQPYKTNFDINNIIIKNVHRDSTNVFALYTSIYKSGILALCEDSLKIHDVTIDGVTGPQQIQLGLTVIPYHIAVQATVNDMYNITVSNTSAFVKFGRPIKNSSFVNIKDTVNGTANAVFANTSINLFRKYYNHSPQFIDSVVATEPALGYSDFAGSKQVEGVRVINKVSSGLADLSLSNYGTGLSSILRQWNVAATYGLANNTSLQSSNSLVFITDQEAETGGTSAMDFRIGGFGSAQSKLSIGAAGLSLPAASNIGVGTTAGATYNIETRGTGTTAFGLKIGNSGGDYMQVYQDASTSYFRSLTASATKDFKIGGKNIYFGTGTASDPTTMTLDVNGKLTFLATNTTTGTTGAQTINKASGKVNFAAAATTLVVTNSLVTTASIVMVTVEGTDATATSARVTLAAGSFTITLNAAATAETKVSFWVIN